MLRAMIQECAPSWRVERVYNPDRALTESEVADRVVASADAWVLDRCGDWVDLSGALAAATPDAWLVELARG